MVPYRSCAGHQVRQHAITERGDKWLQICGVCSSRCWRRHEQAGQASRRATPLWAAARNGHEAVVPALLAAGADKDRASRDGATPLWVAAAKGHAAVVSALLAAGVDKRKRSSASTTPERVAARSGHQVVVSALREKLTRTRKNVERRRHNQRRLSGSQLRLLRSSNVSP